MKSGWDVLIYGYIGMYWIMTGRMRGKWQLWAEFWVSLLGMEYCIEWCVGRPRRKNPKDTYLLCLDKMNIFLRSLT